MLFHDHHDNFMATLIIVAFFLMLAIGMITKLFSTDDDIHSAGEKPSSVPVIAPHAVQR